MKLLYTRTPPFFLYLFLFHISVLSTNSFIGWCFFFFFFLPTKGGQFSSCLKPICDHDSMWQQKAQYNIYLFMSFNHLRFFADIHDVGSNHRTMKIDLWQVFFFFFFFFSTIVKISPLS
ncbi:hypothetical protein ACP275_06G056700 [Erythranthe tilingii]